MTIDDLGRATKTKYPQYGNLSDSEVGQKVLSKYPQYQSQITTTAPAPIQPQKSIAQAAGGAVGNFLKGAYKGAASTVSNVGSAGQRTLDWITKPISEAITGKPYQASPTMNEAFEGTTALKPQGTAQTVGFGAEKVAEFFIPGGAAGKAGKALEVAGAGSKAIKATKFLTEAAGIGAVTKAQGGSNKNVAENLAFAGGAGLIGKGIGKVADKLAPRVINSLIKPLSKDFEFGKNPGLGVIREKIAANSFDDLIGKLGVKRAEIGTEIGQTLKHPKVSTQQVDLAKALSPIDDALNKATRTGDQKMIDALMDFRNSVTGTFQRIDNKLVQTGTKTLKVNPEGALQFKIDVSDSIRWREGLDNDLNKVKTKVYRQVRDLLEEAVEKGRASDKTIPSIKNLNERYANLTSAETAAKYRANITKRLNLTTLGGTITGAAVTAPSISQNLKEGDIEGLFKDLIVAGGFAAGGKALGSPAAKTRIAKGIASLSPEQKGMLSKAIPLLRNVFLATNSQ